MIRAGMYLLICIVASCCGSDIYRRHFDRPLPEGSALLHYAQRRSRWNDMTYGFEFSVPDEVLKERLIVEWGIRERNDPGAACDIDDWSLKWWPIPSRRSKMEAYAWEDRELAEYKCLWFDRDKGRLYIQYGNW
jgi:hypothetical protein